VLVVARLEHRDHGKEAREDEDERREQPTVPTRSPVSTKVGA
jgi:hypothetical protein